MTDLIRFKPKIIEALIKEVLQAKLTGQTYHSENTSQWNREIADEIKIRAKNLGMDRYKFVVQVVIGEQRGEGVR